MFCELALYTQFKAPAQGAAGVLVGRTATGITQHHQFIFCGDLEYGRIDPRIVELSLEAHFILGALGRFEAEIEALAVGRVCQFGLSRRFKAFACTDITMQLGGKGIHHADGWRGLFVTLGATGVAVAQKLIIDVHLHGAVAQAGLYRPVVQRPVGLYIRVETAGGIYFITHQCAFDPQLTADKVLITVAAVLALIEVQAANQGQIARYTVDRLHPAQAAAVKLAIELHDTAALFIAGCCGRNRQILNNAARTGIGIDLQGSVTDIALVVQAQLLMVDALTGVVGNGIGRYRARVGLVGFPALAQRILCAVLLKAAVDQRQLAVFVGLEVELGEGLVPACGAVVAVAVGVHA